MLVELSDEQLETIQGALEGERANLVYRQEGWKETSNTYERHQVEIDAIDSALAALSSEHAQPAQGEWQPIERRILIQLGVEVSSIEAHRIGDWDLPADMAVCRKVALAAQEVRRVAVRKPLTSQIRKTIRAALEDVKMRTNASVMLSQDDKARTSGEILTALEWLHEQPDETVTQPAGE